MLTRFVGRERGGTPKNSAKRAVALGEEGGSGGQVEKGYGRGSCLGQGITLAFSLPFIWGAPSHNWL